MVKSSVTIDVKNINVSAYFCEVTKDFYFAISCTQKEWSGTILISIV